MGESHMGLTGATTGLSCPHPGLKNGALGKGQGINPSSGSCTLRKLKPSRNEMVPLTYFRVCKNEMERDCSTSMGLLTHRQDKKFVRCLT